MDIEEPQVELSEDLASAIIECVRVAEPAIEILVRQGVECARRVDEAIHTVSYTLGRRLPGY